MGAAIRRIIPVLLFCLMVGCSIDHGCKQEFKNLDFDPSLLNCFANCSYGDYKPAKSAKGLSDSFNESKYEDWTNSYVKPAEPCTTYSSRERTVFYNSSLYGFNFSFKIIQEPDNPYLICQIEDPNFYGGFMKMRSNLTTGQTYPITVPKVQSNEDSATAYLSGFTVLDSLVLPQKTYYQVYKLTNELAKAHAPHFSVIDFYLDKTDGLIQFVQKNGDVWNF
jgi:hypothetical protein